MCLLINYIFALKLKFWKKNSLFPPKQHGNIYLELDLRTPQLWISHTSQYTAETGSLLTEGMSGIMDKY